MNSTLQLPQHEPFLRSLPRDITLREIARRNKANNKMLRLQSRIGFQVDALLKKAPTHIEVKFTFALPTLSEGRDRQIWGCLTCCNSRSWGFAMPEDRELRPKLKCAHCQAPTRHGFVGVIGRTL